MSNEEVQVIIKKDKIILSLSLTEDETKLIFNKIIDLLEDNSINVDIFVLKPFFLNILINVIRKYNNSASIVERGIKIIKILSRLNDNKNTSNIKAINIFGNLQVCELIIGLIDKHGVEGYKIAANGLQAIINLSCDNHYNNICFGKCSNLCDIILKMMEVHYDAHNSILIKGFAAITNLTYKNPINSSKFALTNICNCIVKYLGTVGINNKEVIANGLSAISNLSFDSRMQSILVDGGVCEVIINSLQSLGINNLIIAEEGLTVIRNLCSVNEIFIDKFSFLNTGPLVIRVLQSFGKENSYVASAGLACIRFLSSNNQNCTKIGNANGCSVIFDVLKSNLNSEIKLKGNYDNNIAIHGSYCIINLSNNNIKNSRKFQVLGMKSFLNNAIIENDLYTNDITTISIAKEALNKI